MSKDNTSHPQERQVQIDSYEDTSPEEREAMAQESREFNRQMGGGDDDDNFKDTIRLDKGGAVCVQIIDTNPERRTIARHWWHGASIACPKHTSPCLLPKGRLPDCPLCQQGLKAAFEWYLPVILLEALKPGQDWIENEQHPVRLLRVNEKVGEYFKKAGAQPTVIYARKNDEYGTYDAGLAKDQEQPTKGKLAMPVLPLPVFWSDKDLIKFAATVKASEGVEPQQGRVRKYCQMFTGCPLIGLIWGTKKPIRSGYTDPRNMIEWMMDRAYLDRVDTHCGIMAQLEKPFGCIDLDRDEDMAEFLAANPWAGRTHQNKGGRGRKFFVKIKGAYPADVFDYFDEKEHCGEFRGQSTTAILDGLHDSGKLYKTWNEGRFEEIEYSDIVWPKAWKQRESSRKHFKDRYDKVEGGLLDLSKLENVNESGGKIIARCPACAADGSDESGNHLIIYDGGEGHFGCAVDQSAEHYSLIFKLAKRDDLDERRKPEPSLDMPKFVYERKTEKYWQQDVVGIWQGAVHGQAMRLCAAAGLSRRPPKGGGLSAAEAHLVQISQEAAIDYAGPLAGYPAGVYNFSGHKILVTRGFKLIEPEEGEWETLKAIVNGMFGPEQKHYLYATLKYGYEAYRGMSSQPVPMITLCGPASGDNSQECAWKSAFMNNVIIPFGEAGQQTPAVI